MCGWLVGWGFRGSDWDWDWVEGRDGGGVGKLSEIDLERTCLLVIEGLFGGYELS